ncbi:RecX family transcriptional regulator [Sphingorhabdus sp. Alg239-R122]|uniref:regulatory protein RecX n=1 Tax=Sphingorhabdus sp. Alg239-R122 TaxID=2305989 RepID=UPI0013DB953B|nr:RecX family transcriptional regulator [Sphingorhabdus sp. Alg239-R122]
MDDFEDEARHGSARTRRSRKPRVKKPPKPLNERLLRDLALHYVGRYATSAHKLKLYLARKLRERGWEDEKPADLDILVARFAELKYIDDALYASQKAASLIARGYGSRRVDTALYAAGISEQDSTAAKAASDAAKTQAAITMARKRRFGPFAREAHSPEKRQKQLQAMLRGGHDFSIARTLVFADSMDEIADLEQDIGRYEDMEPWHE